MTTMDRAGYVIVVTVQGYAQRPAARVPHPSVSPANQPRAGKRTKGCSDAAANYTTKRPFGVRETGPAPGLPATMGLPTLEIGEIEQSSLPSMRRYLYNGDPTKASIKEI